MEQINIYKGSSITFENKDGKVMVNATQMAKPFGKKIKHWSENNSTTEFIVNLAKVRGIEPNPQFANLLNISDDGKSASLSISDLAKVFPSLVRVVKGGLEQQGTWMHEDVALVFAQWLSPEFYLWCNDRIKELLSNGVATINNDDETILNAITILQKRLEESKARQKELENKVEQDKPKVLFADTVSSSSTSILVGELAKLIAQKGVNIGQNRLFEWLRHNGYLCNRNGNKNYPTQKSIKQGLLEVVERTITKSDGSAISSFTTKITGKGQIYFVNKFINY